MDPRVLLSLKLGEKAVVCCFVKKHIAAPKLALPSQPLLLGPPLPESQVSYLVAGAPKSPHEVLREVPLGPGSPPMQWYSMAETQPLSPLPPTSQDRLIAWLHSDGLYLHPGLQNPSLDWKPIWVVPMPCLGLRPRANIALALP